MHIRSQQGMTLIEVLVGIALMLMIFGALIGVLRASIALSALAKSKAAALEIANTQMEYLRSLPYSSLGTTGGDPSGPVAPSRTVVINGTTYTVTISIVYHDDPADGLGGGDANGIITDYKRASVEVRYPVTGQTDTTTITSNFAPTGTETAS